MALPESAWFGRRAKPGTCRRLRSSWEALYGFPMIPYVHIDVVRLGPVPLQPFGILVALGVLVGIFLAERRARALGIDALEAGSFIRWILLAGFFGGHVFDALLYHPSDVAADPWLLLRVWNGLSSFGGFLGALLGAIGWKYFELRPWFRVTSGFELLRPTRRAKPAAMLPLIDVVLAVFPVAWTLGRAGCAVVHDHPGAHASADAWFAVAYGPGPRERLGIFELRYGTLPQYDLGLLEMLFALLLACAFALTWRSRHGTGWYVVASAILYAPVRFMLDFVRLPSANGGDLRYAGLTPAQWGCCALLLFGCGFGLWLRNNGGTRSLPTAATAT